MSQIEIENRGIDEEIFQNIVAGAENQPFMQTMGMRITYLGSGLAGIKMICPHEYVNHMGSVHGSVISGLLDNVMGCSIETLNKRCVTLELNMNYISAIMEGTEIRVKGHVVHCGKKTAVAEADLYRSDGTLGAKARATFFILPGTIEERIW